MVGLSRGARDIFVLASLLTALALGHAGAASQARGTRPAAPAATVFLIVLENHNWFSIKGNPAAPYINHTLLPLASRAERYFNPPANHPSLPNYLWLEAGTNFGIADDAPPTDHRLTTSRHLVSLLDKAGISWTAYEEGISATACPLADRGTYAVRHDPFVYFDDITNGLSPTARRCVRHMRPYAALERALRTNTVARYNIVTPDLCHDGHDPCAPLDDPVRQTDRWLSGAVPAILASRAYRAAGVLIITWDEGEGGSDGPLGLLVLSRYAKGHGYANTLSYTHSSTLRTVERIFGVRPLLGDAARAQDLGDLFTTVP